MNKRYIIACLLLIVPPAFAGGFEGMGTVTKVVPAERKVFIDKSEFTLSDKAVIHNVNAIYSLAAGCNVRFYGEEHGALKRIDGIRVDNLECLQKK